jgi:hypothetical protein
MVGKTQVTFCYKLACARPQLYAWTVQAFPKVIGDDIEMSYSTRSLFSRRFRALDAKEGAKMCKGLPPWQDRDGKFSVGQFLSFMSTDLLIGINDPAGTWHQ